METNPQDSNTISMELLEILACPACRAEVRLQGETIVCTKCGRVYPVKEGTPAMLIEEAGKAG